MGAAKGGGRPIVYKTVDGKRVPGVTTIIGRWKESGGLIHWAWQCGIDGINYRDVRDSAADAGHLCHAMIEAQIHGTPWTPPPDADAGTLAKAAQGLAAYTDWAAQSRLELVATEVPLVSEEHRFGGTLDGVARLGDALVLMDWKTSNAVYRDYVIQLAAYRELWRECRGEELSAAHLLRVGKEHGDFHHHVYPTSVLDLAWTLFRGMREAYDLDGQLKKAVGA